MQNNSDIRSHSMGNDEKSLENGMLRVINIVLEQISRKTHAHAYIIEGGSAISRFAVSQAVSCAVVCRQTKNGFPCYECDQCKKIVSRQHTDVIFLGLDGEDIRVDDIRKLSKEAYILPTDCDYHIYILAECDRMNAYAQNALLKIIEEPPQNTMFLLLTASKEQLLPTVVSRCRAMTLGMASQEETIVAICKKFPKLTREKAKRVASLQRGLDKIELNQEEVNRLDAIYELVYDFYRDKNTRINEKMPKTRDLQVLYLSVLALAARDIIVSKKGEKTLFVFEEGQEFDSIKCLYSLKKAFELYEAFSNAAQRTAESGNTGSVLAELFSAVK